MALRPPKYCRQCRKRNPRHGRYNGCCSLTCLDKYSRGRKEVLWIKCAGCGKRVVRCGSRRYCNDDCKGSHSDGRVGLSDNVRRHVFAKTDGVCAYCGELAEHVDHVRPVSKGGTNAPSNLVPACVACNLIVGDKLFPDFDSKKRYIQEQRGLKPKPAPEEYQRPAWHAWVYGAMKNRK